MTPNNESASAVHERAAPLAEEDASRPRPGSFDSPGERADFWRQQFERERERLAKLWVAYQDLKAELEDRERQAETVGEELAAEASEETADGPDADEPEELADDEADGETVDGSREAEEPATADDTIGIDAAEAQGDG